MASFILIIISAMFHATWNVLVKLSDDKLAFSVHIQVLAAILFSFVMLFVYPEHLVLDRATVTYAFLSSLFFSFYQILVAQAYRSGDVSMVYPITTSSPLFITLWAYFFLHERVSGMGFLGIVLIIGGCYIMNITRGTGKAAIHGVILALSAAVCYSFGAMADKLGVDSVNTHLYIYLMLVFMAIFSALETVFLHRTSKWGKIEWKLVLAGGTAIMLSTFTYRLGLVDMAISYASSLRQVSALFGLAIGIFFLKESYGLKRAVGGLVIFAGIVLIKLGM